MIIKQKRRRQAEEQAIRKGLFLGRIAFGLGCVTFGVGMAVMAYTYLWVHDGRQVLLFASAGAATLAGAVGRYYLEQEGRRLTPASVWSRTFSEFAT